MSTFRITYRHKLDKSQQAQILTATSVQDAISKLRQPWHSIVSITALCEGTTRSGKPCEKWTHSVRCYLHRTPE